MDKKDVVERLCDLASRVGSKAFNNMKAHDCFCEAGGAEKRAAHALGDFQFEDDVLRFIETAVNKRLDEHERERRARDND